MRRSPDPSGAITVNHHGPWIESCPRYAILVPSGDHRGRFAVRIRVVSVMLNAPEPSRRTTRIASLKEDMKSVWQTTLSIAGAQSPSLSSREKSVLEMLRELVPSTLLTNRSYELPGRRL